MVITPRSIHLFLYWCCRGLELYRRIVVGRVQRDGSLRAWHVGGFLGSEMRDGLPGSGMRDGLWEQSVNP